MEPETCTFTYDPRTISTQIIRYPGGDYIALSARVNGNERPTGIANYYLPRNNGNTADPNYTRSKALVYKSGYCPDSDILRDAVDFNTPYVTDRGNSNHQTSYRTTSTWNKK